MIMPLSLWCLVLCLFFSVPIAAQEQILTLGVLATRPKAEVLARWQPLADYLTRSLVNKKIRVLALDSEELDDKLHRYELDFVLTNPGHYIQLRHKNALSGALATLVESVDNQPLDAFGGVIFTLKQRSDINQLSDFKGKTIAITNTASLGGYQAPADQLLQADVALDTIHWLKTGMPHDAVVTAVLSKKADIGFVRTGILEALFKTGALNRDSVKILNSQNLSSFPMLLSTRLYPEWPFVAMPTVNDDLARHITAQLLLIEHGSLMTQTGHYQGFTIPANYSVVEELLRSLRLPPFDVTPTFTVQDVIVRYRYQIGSFVVVTVVIVVLVLLFLLKNRQLQQAQNQAKQQQQQLESIITSTGVGTWQWNVQTGETVFNEQWANLIGYSLDELAPVSLKMWRKICHPEDLTHSNILLQQHFSGELAYYDCEYRIRHKHGHWVWMLDRGKLVSRTKEGLPLLMTGTHIDISKLKHTEADLRRSNTDLEQFAYAVSHDMRQPLRMVSSYLTLIERALATQLNDETQQFLNFAIDGAKRMDQMIMSLLNFSRVGRGTAMSLVNSRDVVNEALTFLEPEIAENAAKVMVLGKWPELLAYRDELTRLLQNLIGNAIKYHAKDQAPCVDINAIIDDNLLRIEIHDQGIGIDPAQVHRLFKVFSRLQTYSQFEGTGVGLALCRKIVEHHGGQIGVNSLGENQGSCFWFEIPILTSTTDECSVTGIFSPHMRK